MGGLFGAVGGQRILLYSDLLVWSYWYSLLGMAVTEATQVAAVKFWLVTRLPRNDSPEPTECVAGHSAVASDGHLRRGSALWR